MTPKDRIKILDLINEKGFLAGIVPDGYDLLNKDGQQSGWMFRKNLIEPRYSWMFFDGNDLAMKQDSNFIDDIIELAKEMMRNV